MYICVWTQNTKRCVFIIKNSKKNTTLMMPPHTRLSQHKEKNDNTLPRANEKDEPIPTPHLRCSTCHSAYWSTCPRSINILLPEPGKTHERQVKIWFKLSWINDPNFYGSMIQTFMDRWSKLSWINDPNSCIIDPYSCIIDQNSSIRDPTFWDQWSKFSWIIDPNSWISDPFSWIKTN